MGYFEMREEDRRKAWIAIEAFHVEVLRPAIRALCNR
jgi:hypothetical protein